ncbi:MAG: hypothetical protein MHM6MM_004045 [Cercozoa sp. M6MM]
MGKKSAAVAELAADKEALRCPVLPHDSKITLKTIRDAIPAHCFERSYVLSFSYLGVNLLVALWLGVLAWHFLPSLPMWAQCLLWPVYIFVQGCVMTGLWVIGHECGHGGFSDSELVNDIVGYVVHSCLAVPYKAWAWSHMLHHKNCNSLENDEVFVPAEYDPDHDADSVLKHNVITRIRELFVFLFLGWPGYLTFHITGKKWDTWPWNSHFFPWSSMFPKRLRMHIVLSDVCLAVLCYAVYRIGSAFGWMPVLLLYFLPLLVTNGWLVTITGLQHTNMAVPHFRGDSWSWLRGALGTIDRSFGPLLDLCFHHIQDTHVMHHLFSDMPFYHAVEATAAVKRSPLGPYMLYDDTPVAVPPFELCSLAKIRVLRSALVLYSWRFGASLATAALFATRVS